MAERAERLPRPEREHRIGQMLYTLGREGWGVYFNRVIANPGTAEDNAYEKRRFIAQIDALKAAVEAL